MDLLVRSSRLLLLLCMAGVCATARSQSQSNSVAINIADLIVQGELNQFDTSLPFRITPAPAYVYSITGRVHGEGPLFSRLVPTSEPASTAFEAIDKGLSSALQGSVSNPGSQFPSNILSEQVTSGTDGVFNATFELSIDASGVVSFGLTNVAIVAGGQPDTTDRLVFDSGNLIVTALFADVTVNTFAATNVTATSAVLQSSVVCPNSFQAYYVYGTGTSFSGTSSLVSGTSNDVAQNISIPITGLLPHQVYHFKAVAQDVTGPAYGHAQTFTTADIPPVSGTFSAFAGLARLTIPVLSHCSDPEGAALKVEDVTDGAAGTARVASGGSAVTFQFTSNSAPVDYFYYTVVDSFGGAATGRVNMVNYATLAGNYCAVLFNPASQNAAAGILRVTLAATGVCTGSLTIAGVSYPFTGPLDSSGKLSVTLDTSAPYGTTIALSMVQTGSACNLRAAVAMNALRLVASLPPAASSSLLTATYTFLIPPPPGASWEGSGYALVKIAPGGLGTITGALADGAAFSCPVLFDATGRAGVFGLLYSAANRGSLAGTLTLQGSALISGTLVWSKPAFSTAGIDPGPFSITLTGTGERYFQPANAAALQFGTYHNTGSVVLSGGNLNSPIQQWLTVNPANLVTILDPGNENLALSIQPNTGLFSGHFIDPLTGETRTIHGVLLQGSRMGGGYFLGDSVGGAIGIGP